jgi:hypothetical protein
VVAAADGVNFVERQTSITDTFVTLNDFQLGVTYTFKVKARNAFGFSAFSAPVAILAAATPDQPTAPTTTVSGSDILVSWTEPNDNGSPILGYKLFFKNPDNLIYI